MENIVLKEVESEYKKWIEKNYKGTVSNVDDLVNISLTLFQEIKVKNISGNDVDSDMLLFQYGKYGWSGNNFEFNITRQFIKSNEDEPYQLSMTLYFESVDCKKYNCWSNGFDGLEKFKENIIETEGYKLVKDLSAKKYEMFFEQC